MNGLGLLELLDLVYRKEGDEQRQAYEELTLRLAPTNYWPLHTHAAAVAAFGPAIHNTASRTFRSLDRRLQHALRVWREKYGPLNPAQEQYADSVLARCIEVGKADALGDAKKLYPFVQVRIAQAVGHESVHAGFERRSVRVDVSSVLAEAVA